MYAYKDNGFSMRSVDVNTVIQENETVFADYATEEQLCIAFPQRVITINNENIKSQIALLEAVVTNRRQREAILGIDNGWLANIEAQIQALRQQLQ